MVAVIATVAIAAGFAVWQAVYRSEQVIVVGDPGVYLQYGYWIAVHGSARIPASAAAFGAVPGLNFGSTGFFPAADGTITPAFMPGLPLVLAGGEWLAGLPGMLLMAPVIGGCAVLSFAGLVGTACRGTLGARGRACARGAAARAVRVADAVRRAAGPGAAVRRAVPAGRLVRRGSGLRRSRARYGARDAPGRARRRGARADRPGRASAR